VKQHFVDAEVGHDDAIAGTLDNVPFHIFAMKDTTFTGMFMSTYGTLEEMGNTTKRFYKNNNITEKKEFKYTEVFYNHYKYRSIIDSHNAKRHAPISLETTWATKTCPHCVFAYLLAVTEVNCYLASKYFHKKDYNGMLDYQKKFAENLIYNKYIDKERENELCPRRKSKRGRHEERHVLLTLPKKKKFFNERIIEADSLYPQFKCQGYKLKVRTYCKCSPGTIQCNACFAKHYAAEDN
jgi:hypothetical protein